jgi:3-(3-hydroxy-phenyl)propionate hydroxylase
VEITIEREGRTETRSGRWLIGADGARSDVRRSLGIEFPGFTWPERFLVVSTPFDFRSVIPDLVAVSYVCDPERWHFLLQIPGLCRVMFPIAPHESDELALSGEFARSLMAGIVPGISRYEVAHITLYKVHQRVAQTFRQGRAFLMGDAAHINNPLGGMGMNGGIHDAFNLADKLAAIYAGADDALLERYVRQRRTVAIEAVQQQTNRNHQILSERDPEVRRKSLDAMRRTAADPVLARGYVLKSSMISGLRRAAEIQ